MSGLRRDPGPTRCRTAAVVLNHNLNPNLNLFLLSCKREIKIRIKIMIKKPEPYCGVMVRVWVTGTNASLMAATSGARSPSESATVFSMSALPASPWKSFLI
jgi:hypothetical protein